VIIDMPSTTTSKVNSKLVELRERGGATTLGRVLTLVIVTEDGEKTEEAIDAANDASREHPCRVLVVARGARRAAARFDAQIRVGGDAGASEVVVLRLYGPLAGEGASCVEPLLLPDAPIVAWWPFDAPTVPATSAIGALADRRITDSAATKNPIKALHERVKSYTGGDTDLAWTRLTNWRAVLAAALDLPPHEKVTGAKVVGESDSPSTDLLAAWLADCLNVPVQRVKSSSMEGIGSVTLERKSGPIELVRPDGKVGTLTQPAQPERRVALQRRKVNDCLAEELRRLDADEIYEATLKCLTKLTSPTPTRKPAARKPAAGKAPAKTAAKKTAAPKATASKTTASKTAASKTAPTKTAAKPAAATAPKAKKTAKS
jgi:glucose-6-phosphate dehydrogenase assembly protein OpcA